MHDNVWSKSRNFLVILCLATATSFAEPPKLAILLSVDQLRGDYLIDMETRFGKGGFRRLIENGAWYDNAHFGHGCTYTATGHATLSTGGNATEHGMVGNRWYDPLTGESVYCTADPATRILGVPEKESEGQSPKKLLAETIGDVLHRETDGKAKIFSLSQKDRAAILLAGIRGKAFWYNAPSARFVTSSYYYDSLPDWAEAWNNERHTDAYAGRTWDLLAKKKSYRYKNDDERSVELGNSVLGKTFPHALPEETGSKLYNSIVSTPFSDELALSFARRLIESENLGQDDVPDLLCVSLSATDIIGHGYGPYSLEQEDNLLRLDANLAKFFAYLDSHIGFDNITIALSSDHGADGRPKQEDGEFKGDFIPPLSIKEAADAALTEKFGTTFTRRFYVPYLYLDEQAIKDAGLKLEDVERVAAEAVSKMEGIGVAIARTDIINGNYDQSDSLLQRVAKSVHATRSGQVVVFQAPYYQIISRRGLFTATHGSPWAYDTHVPVMFYGEGVPHLRSSSEVGPEHIAPTLAAILEIPAPNKAVYPALKEVLDR